MLINKLAVFEILPHLESVDERELLHDLALTRIVLKLSYCSFLKVLDVGIRN